jgi:hypothetical protein
MTTLRKLYRNTHDDATASTQLSLRSRATTLDFYGIPFAPTSPTDERILFSFTKRNAVEGTIIPNGPRLFWKVTHRIMPGVLIVRPYQPWSHR